MSFETCPHCKKKYLWIETARYKGQKFRLFRERLCVPCNIMFANMLQNKIDEFPEGLLLNEIAVKTSKNIKTQED